MTSNPARLLRVEVRLVGLPTIERLAAGHDRSPSPGRELVFLRVEDTDGAWGWGECSALNRPTYTSEHARGAFELLAATPLGRPVDPAHPMAAAGLEMALTDLALRREGRSLAERLGVTRSWVSAGAAVGLAPVEELCDRVDGLVADGFRRIKLKIQPGHDLVPVAALRERHPGLDLQVDANGSYRSEQLGMLRRLGELGVTVIEQPFAPDDTPGATELVRDGFVVVADEAVSTLADARRLLELGAMNALSLKPPRVGGLAATVALRDWCQEHGVALTAGGMLESGLGRHSLAAVAGLDGFTITGDVSPARRWLAADPWCDLVLEDGRITVPDGSGVAPDPDTDVLDRFTLARGSQPD